VLQLALDKPEVWAPDVIEFHETPIGQKSSIQGAHVQVRMKVIGQGPVSLVHHQTARLEFIQACGPLVVAGQNGGHDVRHLLEQVGFVAERSSQNAGQTDGPLPTGEKGRDVVSLISLTQHPHISR
jgi:hypothetical protein